MKIKDTTMFFGIFMVLTLFMIPLVLSEVFAEEKWEKYRVSGNFYLPNGKLDFQSQDIPYMIENAEIKKVKIFEGGAKMVLKIQTYGDGVLELKIPRNVVDVNVGSMDDKLTVLLDGQPKQVIEKNPNQNDLVCSRHVVIPFSNEASNIEITSFFLNEEPFRNSLGKLYSFDCLIDRSPIVQIKGGVLPDEITCKENLELVFKPNTKDPKCVKPETATVLLQRGWVN